MSNAKTVVQLGAIIIVAAGIIFELRTGAHLGYVLITGGALAFAISTKIRGR